MTQQPIKTGWRFRSAESIRERRKRISKTTGQPFFQPRSDACTAWLPVPKPFKKDARNMLEGKIRKTTREAQSGAAGHDLWKASCAAYRRGAIDADTHRLDQQTNKNANSSKHNTTDEQMDWAQRLLGSTAFSSSGDVAVPLSRIGASAGNGGSSSRKAWADTFDDPIVVEGGGDTSMGASRNDGGYIGDSAGDLDLEDAVLSNEPESASSKKHSFYDKGKFNGAYNDVGDFAEDASLFASSVSLQRLVEENEVLTHNSSVLQEQLAKAEEALVAWTDRAALLSSQVDSLMQQNAELQAFLASQPQMRPHQFDCVQSACAHGRDPPVSPDCLENSSFLVQNLRGSEKWFGFAPSVFQNSSLVQNLPSKNPDRNLFGDFAAGEAQDGNVEDHVEHSFRLGVLEQRLDKYQAGLEDKFAMVHSRLDNLAKSLGAAVQTSLDQRCSHFVSLEQLDAAALRAVQNSAFTRRLDEIDACLLQLRSDLGCSLSTDGILLYLDEHRTSLQTNIGKMLHDHVNQTSDCLRELFVDKSLVAALRREIQFVRDEFTGIAKGLFVQVEFDTALRSMAEDIHRSRDGLVDNEAFVALQTASMQAKEDDEKAITQLWDAVHLLKTEVVQELKRCQDLAISVSGQGGGGVASCSTSGFAEAPIASSRGSSIAISANGSTSCERLRNGDVVCTHSLSCVALNNKVGTVLSYNRSKKRFAVQILLSDGQFVEKLIKAENLRICQSHAADEEELQLESQLEQAEMADTFKSMDDLLSKLESYSGNDKDILAMRSQLDFIQYEQSSGRALGDSDADIEISLRSYLIELEKTKTRVHNKFFAGRDASMNYSQRSSSSCDF